MIVSFHHRFIFVAIPKTATHAFRVALRPHLAPRDWEQCILFEKKFFPVEALAQIGHGHISCQQVRPLLLPSIWNGFFKFCTVRNPYDRFLSYSYFVNRDNNKMLSEPLGTMKRMLQDKKAKQEILFRPQSEFVVDEDGQLAVDYICKFEALQSHFDTVCSRLHLPSTSLQRINVLKNRPAGSVYDEELRGMVQEEYRRDFDLFSYSMAID